MTSSFVDLCQECLPQGIYIHSAPHFTGKPYDGGRRSYYQCPAGHEWFCDWREDGFGREVIPWADAFDEAMHSWGEPPPHDCRLVPQAERGKNW